MKKLVFQIIRFLMLDYYFQRKKKNTLLILLFHQVNDKDQLFYGNVPVATFEKLCQWVKNNYQVISLSEIDSHFAKSNKPAAIISFDDGHYDIKEHALPVLKKLALPFNINIDTEVLETGKPQDFVRAYEILNNSSIESYFNEKYMDKPIVVNRKNPYVTEREFGKLLQNISTEQKREVVEDMAVKAKTDDSVFSRMLSRKDLQEFASENIEIGSHTHTHSILAKLSHDQIEFELVHSKEILEGIMQRKVNILAYPNGISNSKVEEIALNMGYNVVLDVDNEINTIRKNDAPLQSYKRVNMYHKSFPEALAHIYGVQKALKKIKG